jgi:hypothetical protein
VTAEGVAQAVQRRGRHLLGRRIGDVDPDLAVDDLHRVAAQLVAAHQGLAPGQVEFPVVPVAGEDADAI